MQSGAETNDRDALSGTTLRVYRVILKSNSPMGIHEIQRALSLSSPSVAQYHVRKLLGFGLIREEKDGYVIDKVIFDNVIRIRRTSIPLQTAYVAFFGASLVVMLFWLRPNPETSASIFALLVVSVGLLITVFETAKTWRRL